MAAENPFAGVYKLMENGTDENIARELAAKETATQAEILARCAMERQCAGDFALAVKLAETEIAENQ